MPTTARVQSARAASNNLKNPHIDMQSEDLYISENQIRVHTGLKTPPRKTLSKPSFSLCRLFLLSSITTLPTPKAWLTASEFTPTANLSARKPTSVPILNGVTARWWM